MTPANAKRNIVRHLAFDRHVQAVRFRTPLHKSGHHI
jgi:hypothetical protein